MLSYSLKYRKNTKSKKLKVVITKGGIIVLSSKYGVCDQNLSNNGTSGLSSNLGIKTSLSKIHSVGPALF